MTEKAEALAAATAARAAAEAAHAEAEKQYAAQQRAIADRREGLARLAGEVNTLRSRAEAAGAEIERLAAARAEADARAEAARHQFANLETRLAGLSAGESGLDAAYEVAEAEVETATATLEQLRSAERSAAAERGAAAARAEALALGLERRGRIGRATRRRRPTGWPAGLGGGVDQRAGRRRGGRRDRARGCGGRRRGDRRGRCRGSLRPPEGRGPRTGRTPAGWRGRPGHGELAAPPGRGDLRGPHGGVRGQRCVPAIERLLFKVAVVDDLNQGRALVAKLPEVTAVTRDGDLLSAWYAAGGSSAKPSLLEVQVALDEANQRLGAAQAETERLRFAIAEAEHVLAAARQSSDAALARLHESDAEHAALAEEAGEANQVVRSAQAEAGRLAAAAQNAAAARDQALANLGELESRLELASAQTEVSEADPTERDHCADLARAARSAEMDARLALRTVEERARALAGRAESLTRAAEAERAARAKAAARREQLRREAEVAGAVQVAAVWLADGSARPGRWRTRSAPGRRNAATRPRQPWLRRGSAVASWPARSRAWSTPSTPTSWLEPSSR